MPSEEASNHIERTDLPLSETRGEELLTSALVTYYDGTSRKDKTRIRENDSMDKLEELLREALDVRYDRDFNAALESGNKREGYVEVERKQAWAQVMSIMPTLHAHLRRPTKNIAQRTWSKVVSMLAS